eukprot:comp11441_c0_seq1/m.5857 comp11441_c0_seq1/g.5857  ORF comp11441_c0_seq1/g.5857 comp11441_c0_seq1/m.5857 type:complete len:423 (-) comp11441_c0_seq1:16-1284(-)
MANDEQDPDSEVLTQRLINEEYKVWRKNSPFLYDMVLVHALDWPSLTVQWLPGTSPVKGEPLLEHQLLLGTHTSDTEPNFLIRASIKLPSEDGFVDVRKYEDALHDFGGFSTGTGRLETVQKINHEGELNRARYMPQQPHLVATKGPRPEVFVFDMQRQAQRTEMGTCRPEITLAGHTKEGYGLSWNSNREGQLLSGGDDNIVCCWDVVVGGAASMQATSKYTAHTDVVEDVAWHCLSPYVFASVGDDKMLMVWDIRSAKGSEPTLQVEAHNGEVNCVAFNPHMEYLLVTGAADKTVGLWDLRNIKSKVHTFSAHTEEVFQVQWMPNSETVLGSCGADRRVMIWDLSRIGEEQSPEDAEDGPPELLFIHGGHTSKISDFCWNPSDPWTIASVCEDNILHVWQMAENIYNEEDVTEAELEGRM